MPRSSAGVDHEPALAAAADRAERDRPDDRVLAAPRVELDQLPLARRARVERLELACDVEVPLALSITIEASVSSPVQNRNTRFAVVPPRSTRRRSQPCTSPAEFAKYAIPSWNATEFSIENARSARLGEQAVVPARNAQHDLRAHAHLVLAVVAAVELDHVEPRVLAALEQIVADHERRPVPVVVPDDRWPRSCWRRATRARSAGPGRAPRRAACRRASRRSTGGSRRDRRWPSPWRGRPSAASVGRGGRSPRRESGSRGRRRRSAARSSRCASGSRSAGPSSRRHTRSRCRSRRSSASTARRSAGSARGCAATAEAPGPSP